MKVWTSKRHESYMSLTDEARAVVALLGMGTTDLDEIARVIPGHGSKKAKRRFAQVISVSRDPVIVQCKAHSPRDMSAPLVRPVRCPSCGWKIFFVPCQFCCSIDFPKWYTDVHADEEYASEPTRFLPGTPGKMMVMQARLALGEPLFNPSDGKWDRPIRGGRFRCLSDLLERSQEAEEDAWCIPEDEVGPSDEDLSKY